MDLPKFLQMLEQGGLYFALLTEFSDKWEAVLGRELTHSIATHFGGASGDVIQLMQDYSKHTAVNCWYQGAGESVAMWKLYTKSEYGVAIKSTVGDLMKALSVYPPEVFIGCFDTLEAFSTAHARRPMRMTLRSGCQLPGCSALPPFAIAMKS